MTQWFGKSWGAPICAEDEHVATPVFMLCSRCREVILADDQGVMMPLVTRLGDVELIVTHLDCFLKQMRSHGPECPHCRGVDIDKHALSCRRNETGLCDCQPMPEGR